MKRVRQRLRRPADFFADRSALGTALAAAFFALIGLGGIALVGDHVYLTYQRDLLKIAADAAGLAAAYRLPTFGSDVSDEDVKTALKPVVRRYILANVPEGKRQQAQDTLKLTLTPDRTAGTVLRRGQSRPWRDRLRALAVRRGGRKDAGQERDRAHRRHHRGGPGDRCHRLNGAPPRLESTAREVSD